MNSSNYFSLHRASLNSIKNKMLYELFSSFPHREIETMLMHLCFTFGRIHDILFGTTFDYYPRNKIDKIKIADCSHVSYPWAFLILAFKQLIAAVAAFPSRFLLHADRTVGYPCIFFLIQNCLPLI